MSLSYKTVFAMLRDYYFMNYGFYVRANNTA